MTTTPNFSHTLFTTPFDHTTDFTELADNCSRFVDVLLAHKGRHRAAVKKPGGAYAYPAYGTRVCCRSGKAKPPPDKIRPLRPDALTPALSHGERGQTLKTAI